MNAHSTVTAKELASIVEVTRPQSWAEALKEYEERREASDRMDIDSPGADDAMDAYCRAMDHLIDNVPAPNLQAVITKLELMRERFQDREYPEVTGTAVMKDLRRLACSQTEGSLIGLLNARYEAIWDAHNKLDVAQPSEADIKAGDHAASRHYYSCERAMGELVDESDLVKCLILRQTPLSDEDLTIQVLHAAVAFDGGHSLDEGDRKALQIGLDNIVDYLVGEGRADGAGLGRQFAFNSTLCETHRRYREGSLA